MAFIVKHAIDITTTTSGAASAYTSGPVNGFVLAVRLTTDTTLTSSGRATITSEVTGLEILTSSGLDTAFTAYPRAAVVDTNQVNTYYTTGSTGAPVALAPIPIAGERVKIVVSSGGNAKSGTFYIIAGG